MSRFTITPNDNLEATLARVKQTITSKGGSFAGDTQQGQFSGSTPVGFVKGKYTVNANQTIEIVITDKPFIAPMMIIEEKIRNYFA
ncbi:hypothetical protein [Agitococcus lubricus]|uniref:Uncharacterized protein n=1 Tax=Agitococcus lubricus TaxID=1077255 RepID=A0A2T5IWA2_9GAMM|nr:hypothetical protein [Agitococcus lubricus]PTQ88197.1 hypothetical protein C8N29_11457 [Agitococcus lubricus]